MAKEAKSVVFLEGKKTILRPFNYSEVPTLTRWMNHPDIRQFVTAFLPQTEKQEEEWFNKLGSDPNNIVLAIEDKNEHQLIGSMGIHKINWLHRNATTGAIIGESEYWGKGYGTDAKMTVLKYCFDTLNLHKVCSSVIAYNERSLRYSLHCGYKIEGTKKDQLFKDGRYWDQTELAVFRTDWLPIWQLYQATGLVR